ncbi:hypothetical protein [Sphingobium ummariense]|jgi:hypothetical protein|uniref:Stability/partitioning determinant n=1 Tax=Sphingobium ummariense RL-3 TaxID=1346791 RepID=T0J9R2_9SPHN|nr:hypothetical protein [Sphingobium ummariense]EQB33577.1 hypothetical protein M529_03640 [Sphingobium ummariense RL-3]
MTKKPTKAATPLAGVTSFAADEDYIAPPPKTVRDKAKADNGAIGFVSDKPAPARGESAQRKKREATFTAQFTMRIREEDRERFDEYAYRHRISKGEAFRRLLDIAEGQGRAD